MFVFWYCHKRGKETRLAREAASGSEVEIEELDEDGNDTADEKAAEADSFEESVSGEGKFEEMQRYKDMEKDIESRADRLSQPTLEEAKEVPLPDENDDKKL